MEFSKVVSFTCPSRRTTRLRDLPACILTDYATKCAKLGQQFPKKVASLPACAVAVALELAMEPGAGKTPIALGGHRRNPEHTGCLFVREPQKEAQVDDPRLVGVECLQLRERFIERQQFFIRQVGGEIEQVHVRALEAAAMLVASLAPGVLNQDPPHGLGRG